MFFSVVLNNDIHSFIHSFKEFIFKSLQLPLQGVGGLRFNKALKNLVLCFSNATTKLKI